jgi:hypothetical protein
LTGKFKLYELNRDLSGLGRFLKHKKKRIKLWQERRDPKCKREFNRLSKTIRGKTSKWALQRWENIIDFEVIPQAIRPIAKSLKNRRPMQLLIAWNSSSHHMTCVTTTMNGWWRLESKLCSKL